MKSFVLPFLLLLNISCQKLDYSRTNDQPAISVNENNSARTMATVVENFETGSKTSYASASVSLSTGSWTLNDALIGNSVSDSKNGTQSVRVRNIGTLSSNFDFTTGASTISIAHGLYGSDASSTWQLWYSTNAGTSYIQAGSTINTTTTTLQVATFTINVAGNIRLQIRKTDGSTTRINFDDVTVISYVSQVPTPVINSLSPSNKIAGSSTFTLTVSGTGFAANSIINWNGTALPTTYISSTSLTASVTASYIASAGTAGVTVSTSGSATTATLTFTINAPITTGKKFLFDATKAENAGNADWLIDQDNSTAQRIPTPVQSNITSSTSETYWTGAISSWGIALVKAGHTVETLPITSSITYGSTTNAQDLSKYNVFVVDEPNKVFTAAEKTAILNFVQNGGGLFMVSDHTASDRNNDGWDSPEIWNDLMTNNTVKNNPFGFSVDLANFSQVATNVRTASTGNPILNGTAGTVSKLQFNNGTSVTLSPTANSTVQGLVWKNSTTQNNANVMAASSLFGTGRVFFVGDSSPMDDGTGASGNTLFVSWPLYSHTQLFMNASLWLAKVQ